MGIKSLNRWLEWVCTSPKSVQWSNWSGKRIGIDVLGLLYKAKQERNSPTEAIGRLVLLLKKHRIQPIFVFDGKSPTEKQATCTARRRQKEQLSDVEQKLSCVHSNERNEIKQLLYASGCIYLNAEAEADSVLAYMYHKTYINAIISMDMDFLARGCETLLVPYKTNWHEYTLSKILSESKLTYDQFVDLCVLLGTDYNPTIPSLSYQRIYWSLVAGTLTLSEILAKEGIRNDFLWHRARKLLLGQNDSWNSLLSEKQREKWNSGIPNTEWESCLTLLPTWSRDDLYWLSYNGGPDIQPCELRHTSEYPVYQSELDTLNMIQSQGRMRNQTLHSCDYVATRKSADNNSDDTDNVLRAADAAVLEPRITIQNVPNENINSIRNSIADNKIYGKTLCMI